MFNVQMTGFFFIKFDSIVKLFSSSEREATLFKNKSRRRQTNNKFKFSKPAQYFCWHFLKLFENAEALIQKNRTEKRRKERRRARRRT